MAARPQVSDGFDSLRTRQNACANRSTAGATSTSTRPCSSGSTNTAIGNESGLPFNAYSVGIADGSDARPYTVSVGSTLIGVDSLAEPELLVEVEVVAVMD